MISRIAQLEDSPDVQHSAEFAGAAGHVIRLFEGVQYRLDASEMLGAHLRYNDGWSESGGLRRARAQGRV
jgi:hypothetical protein